MQVLRRKMRAFCIPWQDCVRAIHENAFLASPYPVIITMENHADADNQVSSVQHSH